MRKCITLLNRLKTQTSNLFSDRRWTEDAERKTGGEVPLWPERNFRLHGTGTSKNISTLWYKYMFVGLFIKIFAHFIKLSDYYRISARPALQLYQRCGYVLARPNHMCHISVEGRKVPHLHSAKLKRRRSNTSSFFSCEFLLLFCFYSLLLLLLLFFVAYEWSLIE